MRGDYVDPNAGKTTVQKYAARWEAVQVSSAGTKRIVDNAVRLHLLPALGARPMASVRRPAHGELLGLSVSGVDFLRRTIRVERQRMQSGELAPVKSKTSRRTVPVGQIVIDELAAHLAAYPGGHTLFTDELGRPLTFRTWKRLWREAATTARSRAPATICGTSSPRP